MSSKRPPVYSKNLQAGSKGNYHAESGYHLGRGWHLGRYRGVALRRLGETIGRGRSALHPCRLCRHFWTAQSGDHSLLAGGDLTDDQIADLGERKEEYYRAEASKGVDLLPGVQAMLEAFHERGIPQAIGSSAPRGNLEMILDLTKSRPFFAAVVAMEDTKRGKPDPEVFLQAAARLKTEPRHAIVFEDAVAGVQAAKAGGMKCVAVRFVGHHSEAALQDAGADMIVSNLELVTAAEVLALLDR